MPMKMNDDIFVDELKELVMTFSDKGTQDDINYLKELNLKIFLMANYIKIIFMFY